MPFLPEQLLLGVCFGSMVSQPAPCWPGDGSVRKGHMAGQGASRRRCALSHSTTKIRPQGSGFMHVMLLVCCFINLRLWGPSFNTSHFGILQYYPNHMTNKLFEKFNIVECF